MNMKRTLTAALEREYRIAFHNFSEKVRAVQSFTTESHPDEAAKAAACLELQTAHRIYTDHRNALAEHLLSIREGSMNVPGGNTSQFQCCAGCP